MSRRMGWIATVASLAAVPFAVAGCGGATPAQPPSSPATPGAQAIQMETSLATSAGTWATVVMGGPAAQHNNFWQLFIRPAGSTSWKLVTPPGTADNGGLVLAPGAGQALTSAFRPSQHLTFTPLIRTGDAGASWSSLSPLDADLAGTADPLATDSASGTVLALTSSGDAEQTANGGVSWTTLARARTLAASPAGRRCGLTNLTAAAYAPSGTPLLAGACSRPGTVGVFAANGTDWQAAGPAAPAALANEPVTVLRLATAGNQLIALLAAGSGRRTAMVIAWSPDGGAKWTESPPIRVGSAGTASVAAATASFGPGQTAALIMPNGEGAVLSAGRWRVLPPLPAGTAVLAPGPDGTTDALAAHQATLTVWQLTGSSGGWVKKQAIKVPIEYGSSG
jgi:hypothetical protein